MEGFEEPASVFGLIGRLDFGILVSVFGFRLFWAVGLERRFVRLGNCRRTQTDFPKGPGYSGIFSI